MIANQPGPVRRGRGHGRASIAPSIASVVSSSALALIACAAIASSGGCASLLGADFDLDGAGDGGHADASSSAEPSDEDGSTTSPSDDGGISRTDGGKPPAKDGGDASTGRACPGPMPTNIPYKGPPQLTLPCSNIHVAMVTSGMNAGKTVAQLRAELAAANPSCEACVFSRESDSTWGPLVYGATYGLQDDDGELLFLNYGGCFAQRFSGTTCARAVHRADLCVAERCDGCLGAANEACATTHAATASSCGMYFDEVEATCADSQDLFSICHDPKKLIATTCGPPP